MLDREIYIRVRVEMAMNQGNPNLFGDLLLICFMWWYEVGRSCRPKGATDSDSKSTESSIHSFIHSFVHSFMHSPCRLLDMACNLSWTYRPRGSFAQTTNSAANTRRSKCSKRAAVGTGEGSRRFPLCRALLILGFHGWSEISASNFCFLNLVTQSSVLSPQSLYSALSP